MVELLDFGEADVDLRTLLLLTLFQHGGQAVQGLRAEDHVHIGCTLDDGGALLAGHAAAHADHHAFFFEVLDATEVGEDLLLGLLADGAGVEEDQVGFFGVVGGRVAFGGVHDVGHLVRVIFVHLAAIGLDVDLLGLGRGAHGSGRDQGLIQAKLIGS